MADSTGSEAPAQLVAKVGAVLEVLAERGQATAAEVATAIGEPRSSTHRLLRGLEQMGWLEPTDARGRYRLGLQLFRIGAQAVHALDERRLALPHLHALCDRTAQTVNLCLRREGESVCIERIEGSFVQSLVLRIGGSLPLGVGAAAKVLLAHAPRDVAEEAYRRFDEQATTGPGRRVSARELAAEMEEVRERGYAVSDEDVTPGIASIGAPVFDYDGIVRASVSIGGLRQQVLDPSSDMAAQVVDAARRVSRALGARADRHEPV